MQSRAKYVLFILGCVVGNLVFQHALAQTPAVSAQHNVVAASTDVDGRSWLTLSVTLTNGGDTDLTDVKLLTSPGLSPAPGQASDALNVGDLAMDVSVTTEWTFESVHALNDGEILPGPIMFLGEATDGYGDFIAFPIDSTAGAE